MYNYLIKFYISANCAFFDNVKKNKIIPTTPQEAVQKMQKILNNKKGYIKNAVVREDGLKIDFFWGDIKKGVCHLLNSRMETNRLTKEQAEQVAIEVAKMLPDGKVEKDKRKKRSKKLIVTKGMLKAILVKDRNAWLLTGYDTSHPVYDNCECDM